jgi:hypothetical protein
MDFNSLLLREIAELKSMNTLLQNKLDSFTPNLVLPARLAELQALVLEMYEQMQFENELYGQKKRGR